MNPLYIVMRPFEIGTGSHTRNINSSGYIQLAVGDVVEHEDDSDNGNVWLIYNGKRGKIEAGCIGNLQARGMLRRKM